MNKFFFKTINNKRLIQSLQDKKDDPFLIQEGRFNLGELKDSVYYSDWTEETLLVNTKKKEIINYSFNFAHLKYFAWFVILGLIILISRSFWLQINKNNYYSYLSEGNRLRTERIEPKRGIIYNNKMQALVRNRANFILYFKPSDLPRNELARDSLLRQISYILSKKGTTASDTVDILPFSSSSASSSKDFSLSSHLPTSSSQLSKISIVPDNALFYKLKNILSTVRLGSLESYQPLVVADNISYNQAMLINLKLATWPGVFLTTKIRREYILPTASSSPQVLGISTLAHVLGYTGKISTKKLKTLSGNYSPLDYIGKTGIEYYWEKELRGVPGQKSIEVDALGRQKQIMSIKPAIDGNNLELSLDSRLQQQVAKITKFYMKKLKLHKASVIVMNPNNGKILALVSLPGYNNNLFAAGISQKEYSKFLNDPNQPLFNRAISGEFPSGSTIKPIFAAGALQDKIITEKTTVLSTGGLRLGQWFFPDWKVGGHGITDVKKALAWSVNTFFYYIGGGYKNFKGLGVSGLVKYARLFGLGQKTGIDLPGEKSGFIPTAAWKKRVKHQNWYIGDTYHFAIGQGYVLVTPLQVANYTAAIANGGTLYKPYLVERILDSNNKVIKNIQPVVLRRNMVSDANLKIVREGLRQVVTKGSGRFLRGLPVTVAGKTGTAQWSNLPPDAWFTAFAPYDKPQIVVTALVEQGIEGSTITTRITRAIIDWYFTVDHPVNDNSLSYSVVNK